jgi:hypothetical protein
MLSDLFHLLTETVELLESRVNIRRDPDALKFFVDDWHGEEFWMVAQ